MSNDNAYRSQTVGFQRCFHPVKTRVNRTKPMPIDLPILLFGLILESRIYYLTLPTALKRT